MTRHDAFRDVGVSSELKVIEDSEWNIHFLDTFVHFHSLQFALYSVQERWFNKQGPGDFRKSNRNIQPPQHQPPLMRWVYQ